MMLLGRGATKALVEETTQTRAPRIETVFMVAMVVFERYDVW
jgi:hypothetical protein